MTVERAVKLDKLGFVSIIGSSRQVNDAAWEAQLARLAAYKAVHGDCNVPQRWAEDPRLGIWVTDQQRCKRKLDRGEPSQGMTAERVAKLTALGLTWDPGAAAELAESDIGPTSTAWYPLGARVTRLFGDGWYDGTVLEAPWPPDHRWGRWRRVRFDDGETHDVDTDTGPACFRALDKQSSLQLAKRGAKRQKQGVPFTQLLR
jgi:hypothetical protein